ncbi:MAG TPA: hypothetical protein VLM79_08680, partial [Kofleriaceae bacterium]|nr:hypothetical protein [Kofleriaceae bacterium]
MGHGIQRKPGASTLVERSAPGAGARSPGKRTLTEQLGEPAPDPGPILRKALGDVQLSNAAVQAQVHRASGEGGGPLPGGLRGELDAAPPAPAAVPVTGRR